MEQGATTNRSALVVDDSRATRSLLRRLLGSFGHEVDEAGDGYEALRALDQHQPIHIARALMAGADEYALKPMTREAPAEKLHLIGLSA